MMVMKVCGSLEEYEINSARYLTVGIDSAKIRSVAYAMENTLGSLLSSETAVESPDDNEGVLGVLMDDDDAELDVEEAIFCCKDVRYA